MPYAQDLDTGEWIEVDTQGNPVASAPRSAGRVFTLPKSGDQIRKDERQDASDARAEAAADRAAAASERQAGADERAARAAELDAALKRLQIMKAEAETGGGPGGSKKLNTLVAQINRVQDLYDENIGTTKGLAGLQDYLPTNENARFDTAGAQLSQIGLAAFRTPGTGTVSDRDAIMFDKGNLPTASTRDAAIEEILGGLRRRVEEEFQTLGQPKPNWTGVAQQRADDEVPGQATGGATKPPPSNPSGTPPENGSGNPPTPWDQPQGDPGQTIATGGGILFGNHTKTIRSDRLSAQVDAMINAGAGLATINAALKQQGFPEIRGDQYNAARKWMQENPGKQYYGADITREEDLPLMSRIAGSSFGSGAASYADAATAGIVGSLAGDKGRGALDAMKQVNPTASGVGNILGGITGAAGAELGVMARAPAALARYAPRIADTLYGGLTGFNNAQSGEGGSGALTGALGGLAGGVIGERAVRGVGNLTQGVRNPNVQALRDAGVELTVGQTVGDSGWLGAGVKKLEDAGTSLPFIGNMIDARRTEGLRGFNDAAFNTAAAPGAQITARGAEGMGQVRQSVTDAYGRALDPVTIDTNIDQQMVQDLAQAQLAAGAIPNVAPTFPQDFAMTSLENRIQGNIDPNGLMSGRNFQEAYRGLGRDARGRTAGDYGHEIGQVTRQGQDLLGEALERQNPGAFEGFLEANAANRRANVLADALKNAGNQGEELITPAQLNRADIGSTSRLEGKINSASGNRPFYDLATAGQAVLPSRLPDSGTATRAAVVGGLGMAGLAGGGYAAGGTEGAATGTGLGLGATIALALGGSRPAQQIATRMLLDRPDLAVRIGEQINRNSRVGGWTGAGVLTPLVVGQ